MRRWRLTVVFTLCFLLRVCGAVFAQDATADFPEQQLAAIDAAMAEQIEQQALVGVAIGIIRDNQVVLTKAYGYANRERQEKMTTSTIVNWGSNSKPIVAVLALQLVAQGQLDLDADVRQYVPQFPDKGATISSRQLLSHQSGLPHYLNGEVIASPGERTWQEELDPLQAIKRFDRSPLIFQPGERMDYSSHAYVLLSAVVQQAGGEPIQKQLEKRILQPLGMKSFQLDVPFDGQKNWATGYMKLPNGWTWPTGDQSHAWKHGAGAYKSDVRDFARWAAALSSGELLDPQTQKQMWTNQTLRDGSRIQYGLGVIVEGEGMSLKVSHNGSQNETRTRMVLYPRQKHGMVVMSNTSGMDPGAVTTAIYRAIATP